MEIRRTPRMHDNRTPRGIRSGRTFGLACAALVLAGGAIQPTPAAAFLEFLFGRRQPPAAPAQPQYYQTAPLDVSVRPRRSRGHAERGYRHKRELGRGGSRHADKAERDRSERKANRQVSIDPAKNPDWYLKDPNLRYGDILILKSGPVVYQGSRQMRASEDFVLLGQSKILSRTDLRDIRMMVSGVWTPGEANDEAPRKRGRRGRR